MKSTRMLACAAAATLAFAACGSSTKKVAEPAATTKAAAPAATTAAPAAPAAKKIDKDAQAKGDCATDFVCIGVVTDVGKVDDKSFNQSTWEGALQAAANQKGRADYIETVKADDYNANIKNFLDKKYDIIVTVGFAMGTATDEAGKANPGVHFIGVDQFKAEAIPNVTGLIFSEDKAGFMAGALAGYLTKSNIVAAVLGTDKVPPVVAFKVGWENGAKHTNPKVKNISTFHPGAIEKAFGDPEWGATTAKQALDQGADVLFGAGGATGNGAIAEVAKKKDALCVGVDTDQWNTVPEAHPCLVTSSMKLLDKGVIDLVAQWKAKTIKGGIFVGDVGLADYHDLASKVPADVQTKMKALIDDVRAGKIPTGYTPG
jgi:basic membrane protein A and related proteins